MRGLFLKHQAGIPGEGKHGSWKMQRQSIEIEDESMHQEDLDDLDKYLVFLVQEIL